MYFGESEGERILKKKNLGGIKRIGDDAEFPQKTIEMSEKRFEASGGQVADDSSGLITKKSAVGSSHMIPRSG